MKTKSIIFALCLGLMSLSGCVATMGPDYGYYPPVQPYYVRPYYAPRPVIVGRPYYRPGYGGGYYEGGHRGYGNGGYGGGHGRRR